LREKGGDQVLQYALEIARARYEHAVVVSHVLKALNKTYIQVLR